jgi:hypothetical protein
VPSFSFPHKSISKQFYPEKAGVAVWISAAFRVDCKAYSGEVGNKLADDYIYIFFWIIYFVFYGTNSILYSII